MRITHQQIADQVGVSRTLVTHVLHRTPHARISENTRHAILKVAEELGYEPRARSTHSIGYVMSTSQMRLEAEMAQIMLFEQSLRKRGYRLTLASWEPEDPGSLREVFNVKTVDGIIFNTWGEGRILEIVTENLPWILLSDEDGVDAEIDIVALDAQETARRMTRHLVQNGHERLGLIQGISDSKFHRRIIRGIHEVMEASGLNDITLQMIRPYYAEEVADELLSIMHSSSAPTAWVITSPGLAITTLYTLRSAGYNVPQDVSLVALFDNDRYRALPPVLTATDALGTEFVECAVSRLIDKITNNISEPSVTYVAGNVIERDSVSCLRKPVIESTTS